MCVINKVDIWLLFKLANQRTSFKRIYNIQAEKILIAFVIKLNQYCLLCLFPIPNRCHQTFFRDKITVLPPNSSKSHANLICPGSLPPSTGDSYAILLASPFGLFHYFPTLLPPWPRNTYLVSCMRQHSQPGAWHGMFWVFNSINRPFLVVGLTLIVVARGVAIEGVQQHADDVAPAGNHVVRGHVVKGHDGQHDPGVTWGDKQNTLFFRKEKQTTVFISRMASQISSAAGENP